MLTAIVAILCVFTLAFTAIVLFGGAYLFYRGKSGGSPLPPAVERIVNPPAKPTPPPEPVPPSFPCPHCSKGPSYTLTKDQSAWKCNNPDCGKSFPHLRFKIGV